MKRVLITGANSYIGTSVEKWLIKEPDKYIVDIIDVKDEKWVELSFAEYDVIFHVAAIVHKKQKLQKDELYFKVNRDLPIRIAKKAKKAGVAQFIFMSTMAVYGEEGAIGKNVIIDEGTRTNPKTIYAISKMQAEEGLCELFDKSFKIVILRPPMVYGDNCPGNYAKLEKIAIASPIFPKLENKRSVIHVDKLSEFIKKCIDNEMDGVYLPQDDRYINTSLLVQEISKRNGKYIYMSKFLGKVIEVFFRNNEITKKVFGNLIYK